MPAKRIHSKKLQEEMKAAAESEGRQLRAQSSTSAISIGSGTSASRKRRGAAEQEEVVGSETTSSTSHGQLSGGEEENTPQQRAVSSSMRERFGFHPRESKRGRQEETEEEEKQQTEEPEEEGGEQESLASVRITGETSTSVATASEAEVPAAPPPFGEWADTTREATRNDNVPVTTDNEQRGRFEILTAWLAGEIDKYSKAPAEIPGWCSCRAKRADGELQNCSATPEAQQH